MWMKALFQSVQKHVTFRNATEDELELAMNKHFGWGYSETVRDGSLRGTTSRKISGSKAEATNLPVHERRPCQGQHRFGPNRICGSDKLFPDCDIVPLLRKYLDLPEDCYSHRKVARFDWAAIAADFDPIAASEGGGSRDRRETKEDPESGSEEEDLQ